jgi:pSer/pThr/pTyr-binding forkhead associated (FHA) protein
MAKLILSMDGLVLNEITLTKERTTIGRKPHNDIQIDNLAISGEHAVILTLLNDSFLEDLESTNGTFVNGQAIKRHFLQNGDVVELGKYRIKYVSDATAQANADQDKTMILRPDDMSRQLAAQANASRQMKAAAAAPSAPAVEPMAPPSERGMIQVLSGASAGKELELTKTLTTLGRPGVQVAVIARRPQGYFITHVEGATCPTVRGQTLDANKPRALKDHDIIEIAGVKMEFFLKV